MIICGMAKTRGSLATGGFWEGVFYTSPPRRPQVSKVFTVSVDNTVENGLGSVPHGFVRSARVKLVKKPSNLNFILPFQSVSASCGDSARGYNNNRPAR
jgi:hypothetical protein